MSRFMMELPLMGILSSSGHHMCLLRCWFRVAHTSRRNVKSIFVRRYSSLPGDIKSLRTIISPDISSRIRNIGIMAHIDAGKTTTTERMLYYAGYTRAIGDVDDGDTVTDFMAQERERGITIQSAAVTFDWKNHRVNLIDTPGHVDFTIEVERSLRVLDGAVAVFDASAGVEAQTLTVWRQADKHQIPRICFLNKMDKPKASFSYSIESIKQKLKVKPLLLQLPVGTGKTFNGVVDLVTNEKVLWCPKSIDEDDGTIFSRNPLTPADDHKLWKEARDARFALIEQVADLDDEFAELVLEELSEEPDAVPAAKLNAAIRRITLAQTAMPVLCGSALKNKGVQLLMDAITKYLPAPNECKLDYIRCYEDDLCALAFKVVHDKQRGPLVFVRIYSGTMKPQSAVYNINKNCIERMSRLLLPFADQQIEIPALQAGNIALTVGLKQAATGDTIVSSKSAAAAAARRAGKESGKNAMEQDDPVLATVEIPEPVFFCTIEPPSMAKQPDLDHALVCLQREDPSLKVKIDPDSGQTILCGMGELHIEIIHDRIKREYGIDAYLGPLQVAYRETITQSASSSDTLDRTVGEKRNVVTAEISVHPWFGEGTMLLPLIEISDPIMEQFSKETLHAVENGIKTSCLQGPLLRFPVQDVVVALQSLSVHPGSSLAMISACVSRSVQKALKQARSQVLEPVMSLEITVDEKYLSVVLADLAQRRGSIREIQNRQDSRVALASVPLAETMGYSTALRTLTSGNATFTLEFSNYEAMNLQDQNMLFNKMMGMV
ncbi:ribosome-releasing factor 2, mitochondrial isoform X1 [Stegostoma tigrinum]|uniref:ribosome-releasing factor 2, mitochondrial isoform X1 n=2 Tax=Stegostoma tigrinum TaxID=3053191 RepID=UPI00202B1FF0|nr:ribosome-releasing factor 2, mitochondrial isoform X1 [Stegostoma tigrinum]